MACAHKVGFRSSSVWEEKRQVGCGFILPNIQPECPFSRPSQKFTEMWPKLWRLNEKAKSSKSKKL